MGTALAAEITVSSEPEIYSNGDTIDFNVTAAPGNYSIVFPDQSFEKDFVIEGFNRSQLNKTVSHTFEDIAFDAYVEAELENESARTQEFYVGTGLPVFKSVTTSPDFPKPGDFVEISVRVADADVDVNDAVLKFNDGNETIEREMSEKSAERPYYRFESGFRVEEEGRKSYSVEVSSNSSDNSYSSNVRVFPEDYAGDETDISAYVSSACGMEVDPFRPPGGGIMTYEGNGSFYIGYERDGGYALNASGHLDVIYEGINFSNTTDGEPGEMLEMPESYEDIDTDEPFVQSSDETALNYGKTDRYGYYTGSLQVNATCYRKIFDEEYFEDLGISYTQDDLYSRVDSSPDDDPFLNFTTNETFRVVAPGGGSGDRGSPTGNQTTPEDANQSGEESDETIEGDGPSPGQTPNPVPEPVPDPVPEPQPNPVPVLSINIEETESPYTTPRGRYSPIELQITNEGNISISNIQLEPLVGSVGDWQSRSASIGNLSGGESVNRSVFLRPPSGMSLGEYRIPLLGRSLETGRDLELNYINVDVVRDNFTSGVSITEIPDQVDVQAGSSTEIPLLLSNTGMKNISNVSVEIQNLEECGSAAVSSDVSMSPNSTASAILTLNASQNLNTCNTTVIVSTEEGAYSFSDFAVNVEPEQGVVPPEFRVPLIAILWTAGLIAYAVARRKLEMDTLLIKGPFVIMVMGEALIVIYLAAQYYSIVPSGILPF